MQQEIQISDDGIAVFDGFFPKELCDGYVRYFDELDASGFTRDRWSSNVVATKIEDKGVSHPEGEFLLVVKMKEIAQPFLDIFWNQCYTAYSRKFNVLKNFEEHKIYTIQLQKTEPAQGYHVWHAETGDKHLARRIMFFILYLNDVDEGGETEFLYLKRRITPKTGRLLLCPTGYLHAHRGNPPLSNNKYIVTGWLEF